MVLNADEIYYDGLCESLRLYQRSLVWAIAAAISSVLLSSRFRQPSEVTVEILYGHLSSPVAWLVSVLLFAIFSSLAVSAILRARQILVRLSPPKLILDAILMYPSLATLRSGFFRVGSVLVAPIALLGGVALQLDWPRRTGGPEVPWFGTLALVLIVLLPYSIILNSVWHPLRLTLPETEFKAH